MDVNIPCTEKGDVPQDRTYAASRVGAEEEMREGVERENRQHVRSRVRHGGRRRRSSATATDTEPGYRSNKEECGVEATESSNTTRAGQSRSNENNSCNVARAIPEAGIISRTTADTAGNVTVVATPGSPSTSGRGGVDASQPSLAAEAEESRRKSSKSNGACFSLNLPSPNNDGNQHRDRICPSSPHSSARLELVPREDAMGAATPTSQAPSSVQGTKRRKRSSSSGMVPTKEADEEREDQLATQGTPSRGCTAEASSCCPNETSSAGDKRSKSVQEHPTAVEEISAAVRNGGTSRFVATGKRASAKDQRQTEVVSAIGSNVNILSACPRSERGREESASPRERYLGRQKKNTTRRHDEVARGTKARRRGRDGVEDVVPRRKRSSGSTKYKRSKGKPEVPAVDPPPHQALGVEVVDKGSMKQLVISTDDTTAAKGKKSASKRSSDRSSSTASSRDGGSKSRPTQAVDTHSPGREQKLLHRRRPFPLEKQEKDRSKAFRNGFTEALLAQAEDKMHPASCVQDVAAEHETPTRRTCQHTPPPARSSNAEEKHSKQAQPHDRCDYRDPSPKLSGHGKTGVDCAASLDSSRRMAPSFSLLQHTKSCNQPNKLSPPMEIDVPPEMSVPRGRRGDVESPSSTSSSSSFLRRPGPERTAMYVSQQKSFHADISADFIDLTSPVGGVRGKGGGEAADGSANGNQPHIVTVETGIKASRMGAVCGSNSAPTVDDTRSATSSRCTTTLAPNAVQQEQRPPPMVLAVPPSPETAWERRSGGERGDSRQEATAPAARRATASANAVSVGDPKSSSPMYPVKNHATISTRERGNMSSDCGEARKRERGATPPLSPAQSKEPSRNAEEDCCGQSEDLVHFRTDTSRHLLGDERPALFFLRPNENLAVTRIEGSGRLLVTLREEAGAEVVAVDGAIVHDSAAHFGDAAINTDHRFPYVAGHRYEFQVVPAQGVELAVRGNGDRQGTAASCMPQAKKTSQTGLHVVFSVTSAYSKGARLCEKDAMQVSLPTFEATPPKSLDQHPATPVSSAPAAAENSQLCPTFVAAAPESCPSPKPRFQGPGSVGDRRSSQVTASEARLGPSVSPPPVGVGLLATSQSGVEASAQRPGDPATAPVPKAPAVTSSDRVHRGNGPYQFAARPAHSEAITGMIQGEKTSADKALAGRLRWNPAWEKQDLLPSSSTPTEASRQKPESTLPYIRRHLEQNSPRSGFDSQEPSGNTGNFERMDSAVGAKGHLYSTGYFGHDPPVQGMRHVVPSGAEGETKALRYHRPARKQQLNAPQPCYERAPASPGSYGTGNAPEVVWNQRRHLDKGSTTATGGGSNWGGRRDYAFGGNSHGEDQTSPGNYEHGRWRGRVTEGQARNGGPELRRRSEQDVFLAGDWNGYDHGYHLNTSAGPNGDQDPNRYQFHHNSGRGSERGKAPILSGSNNSRGGYTQPPRGSLWEQTKMMERTPPEPSRGPTTARWRIPMGRGTKGDVPVATSTGEEVHRSRKREGYSGSLAVEKERFGGEYAGGLSGGDQARNDHDSGPYRTRQNVSGNYHQPPANRNSRHGNRGGARAGHQAGFAINAADRAGRMPPRWIKF